MLGLQLLSTNMSFSPQLCPNPTCHQHQFKSVGFNRRGYFHIKRARQYILKFQCKQCKKIFSSRTLKPDYRHKKMDLNLKLHKLLVEGSSLRSCARILNMTYYNTYKKFLWLRTLVDIEKKKLKLQAKELQFDEMETIHHTKCKPLSIAIFVNENHQILELKVAQMPAKGRLAQFSVKKYGYRSDERVEKMKAGFESLKKNLVSFPSTIKSDAHPTYLKIVKQYFPNIKYEQINQADKKRHQDRLHEKLQKKRFDPLFNVNHKCALLRSQIKRLCRRSWCTTKKVENLQLHLDLFLISQFI